MPTLETILANKYHDSKAWESLIKNDDKIARFLLLFTPLMSYVFKLVWQSMVAKQPRLTAWISEERLRIWIYEDFFRNANPIIIRVCVLEMHIANQNNLLLGKTSEKKFDYFVEQLSQSQNTIDLLNKYSILKNLLSIYLRQSIQVLQEFFSRLDQDREALKKEFFRGKEGYTLSALQVAGDRHQQGREVMILSFSKGKQLINVVYKPHSLAVDVAFQEFLTWFNTLLPNIKLLPTKIINKMNYGWTEFIGYQPCQNQNEFEQFYYRSGLLLMVLYLFRGQDIHAENIIAHGSHPVVLDYECLFTPIAYFGKKIASMPKKRFLVSDMYFLPNRVMLDVGYQGVDMSALGAEGNVESFHYALQWQDVGKVTMHAERVRITIPPFLNKPSLTAETTDLLAYEQVFLQGFVTAYKIFLSHLSELRSNKSRLGKFKAVRVRVLLRDTSFYEKLIVECWHPKLLYSPQERANYFKILRNITAELPGYKKVIAAELMDMNQGNIPIFTAKSTVGKFFDSRGKVLNVPIVQTGYDAVIEHIKTLSLEDMEVQKQLISDSFEAIKLNKKMKIWSDSGIKMNALSLAKRELSRLSTVMIENKDYIFWHTIDYIEEANVWQPMISGFQFYNGIPGIGLSFAYGAKIFADRQLQAIAKKCLKSTLYYYAQTGLKNCFTEIGAFSGLGGSLYTLNTFYHLWKDPKLRVTMKRLLKFLPDLLREDTKFDIHSGAAGCLTVLLTLQDSFSATTLLPLARACADHIINQYPSPNDFLQVKALSGFSHGISGIAWALDRLNRIDPRAELAQWIAASFEHNEQTTNKERIASWCEGLTGVTLAAIDNTQYTTNRPLQQRVKTLLESLIDYRLDQLQCLCHGNMGILELLLIASQNIDTINNIELKNYYRYFATNVLYLLEQDKFKCDQPMNLASPGLMTGCAGIVYQLLRIAHPEQIPSILLLQGTMGHPH